MKDNLVSKIARHYVEERVSKKTENTYYVAVIEYTSGYKYESFLNNEQLQLIKYASDHKEDAPLGNRIDLDD